jgi:hypothetical protein
MSGKNWLLLFFQRTLSAELLYFIILLQGILGTPLNVDMMSTQAVPVVVTVCVYGAIVRIAL